MLALAILLGISPVSVDSVRAQNAEPTGVPVAGTEYFVTFLQNDISARPKFMGLLASAQSATVVQVEVPNGDGSTTLKNYDVAPGQITTIPIPASVIPPYYEEPAPLAIHVTARSPIALFAVNDRYQSVGATPVIPVSHWGLRYLPTTLPNSVGTHTGELSIVAAYDSTVLTIVPSTRILFQDAGRERTITLNRGDVFHVRSAESTPGHGDLSGSEISSWSRPIGLFVGHTRSPIALDGSVDESLWSSHVMTMAVPDSAWGNEYYTLPLTTTRTDRYRLSAANNGTLVTATHFVPGGNAEQQQFRLDRGEIVDIATIAGAGISGPVRWQGDGPISIAQLGTSGPYGSPSGAPAFVPSVGTNAYGDRTVFVAPSEFAGDPFPQLGHALAVIVTGNSGETEASILSSLTLDNRPFAQATQSPSVVRIGGENVFVVRGVVAGGGHTLTAVNGHHFVARLVGTGDAVGRDFYAMTLPYWLPQAEVDAEPPFMVSAWRDAAQANVFNALFSDNRAPDYFSGLWSVRVVNSPGWEMPGSFIPPNPDDEASVRFRATTDPSGPLFAELRDRDGNVAVIQVTEGICVYTATVDRSSVAISVPANELPRSERVVVRANPCGDQAHVEGAILGVGTANAHLTLAFTGGVAPFTLDAFTSDTIELTVKAGTPEGTYSTSVILRVDGFTFSIPVSITVGPPSSAPLTGVRPAGLSMSVIPNPATSNAVVAFDRPLGPNAHLVLADPLGRVLFSASGDALRGRNALTLSTVDMHGGAIRSGTYLLSVTDGAERAVRMLSIVR